MGLTVFAIANATELAFGKDPLLCLYDTEVMQIHLLQYLESRKLERFPLKRPRKIPIGNHIRNTYKVKVYCICHMPNNPHKAMGLAVDDSLKGKDWHCNSCR